MMYGCQQVECQQVLLVKSAAPSWSKHSNAQWEKGFDHVQLDQWPPKVDCWGQDVSIYNAFYGLG